MRAEAEDDGNLGILLVGFEATQKSYFCQKARPQEKYLARRVINGERFAPGERSLWFFEPTGACPAQRFNQWNTRRYKSRCFFSPAQGVCAGI